VVNPTSSFNTPPQEQFKAGYSIYQVSDGSFVVYTLDKNGNRNKRVNPLSSMPTPCAL
jgi:hypothetical protein